MQQRRRRQRERRKSSELYQKLIRGFKTTTFHMNRAIYILHISLPFLHDYDAKFLISRHWRTRTQDDNCLILFLNLDTVL